MLTKEFIDERRTQLLELKAKLEAELEGIEQHVDIGASDDDNAVEFAINESNEQLRMAIGRDLVRIEKALAKIEAGNYGTDDEGNNIPEERLEVEPQADTLA